MNKGLKCSQITISIPQCKLKEQTNFVEVTFQVGQRNNVLAMLCMDLFGVGYAQFLKCTHEIVVSDMESRDKDIKMYVL